MGGMQGGCGLHGGGGEGRQTESLSRSSSHHKKIQKEKNKQHRRQAEPEA